MDLHVRCEPAKCHCSVLSFVRGDAVPPQPCWHGIFLGIFLLPFPLFLPPLSFCSGQWVPNAVRMGREHLL